MTKRLLALLLLLLCTLPACAESAWPPSLSPDDVQPGWLVIDVDSSVHRHYVHPATFTIPKGFSRGEFTKYVDGVAQDFYLIADDEAAPVANIYVDAVSGVTSKELIQRYISLSDTLPDTPSIGAPFTAEVAGETAACLYMHYSEERGDYGVLVCFFDAQGDICVNALLTGAYTTPENVQTQEELLEQARTLLAGLTIIH